jgi:hypothetical protein
MTKNLNEPFILASLLVIAGAYRIAIADFILSRQCRNNRNAVACQSTNRFLLFQLLQVGSYRTYVCLKVPPVAASTETD